MATTRMALSRLLATTRRIPTIQTIQWNSTMTKSEEIVVEQTKIETPKSSNASDTLAKKELTSACGDINDNDEEMEQEEMFVDADASLGTDKREWGGPRRGGRFPEPTRYGDWERKGRCSDF